MSIELNWMLSNEYARTMEFSDLFKSNVILRHQCSSLHLYLSHSNSLLLIVSFCSAIFAISFCLCVFFSEFSSLVTEMAQIYCWSSLMWLNDVICRLFLFLVRLLVHNRMQSVWVKMWCVTFENDKSLRVEITLNSNSLTFSTFSQLCSFFYAAIHALSHFV